VGEDIGIQTCGKKDMMLHCYGLSMGTVKVTLDQCLNQGGAYENEKQSNWRIRRRSRGRSRRFVQCFIWDHDISH
jgi:hypothetical protein